jgi:hypothetical protein
VHRVAPSPPPTDSTWPGPLPQPDKPAEPRAASSSPDEWRRPGVRRASELFFDQVLQRRIFERHIGVEPFELAVFQLQLLEALYVRGLQPAVFRFPFVVRCRTDPVLPPELVDGSPGIGFFEDRYDLRLGELRLAHGNLLAKGAILPEDSPLDLSQIRGSLRLRLYHYIFPVFIFPDNSDNRFRGKPFDADFEGFTLNSRGFKDTEFELVKSPDSIRIAGIGDSFVFGVVPYQYNFLTLLEKKLNGPSIRRFEVLNMGIPRTSPREYFSVLVKEALPLRPDVALICIFVGNDFSEISLKPILHRSFVIAAGKYLIDSFQKIEGNNVYGNRTQYHDDEPTFSDTYFLEIEEGRTEVFNKSDRFLYERLPRLMAWMDEIKTVCEGNGIQLFVLLIPDELQVNTDLRERVLAKQGIDKDKLDFNLPNERLGEELRARSISYLDLLEPFRQRSRDLRLYKPRDTHWNLAGNHLAADLLADWLQGAIDQRRGS